MLSLKLNNILLLKSNFNIKVLNYIVIKYLQVKSLNYSLNSNSKCFFKLNSIYNKFFINKTSNFEVVKFKSFFINFKFLYSFKLIITFKKRNTFFVLSDFFNRVQKTTTIRREGFFGRRRKAFLSLQTTLNIINKSIYELNTSVLDVILLGWSRFKYLIKKTLKKKPNKIKKKKNKKPKVIRFKTEVKLKIPHNGCRLHKSKNRRRLRWKRFFKKKNYITKLSNKDSKFYKELKGSENFDVEVNDKVVKKEKTLEDKKKANIALALKLKRKRELKLIGIEEDKKKANIVLAAKLNKEWKEKQPKTPEEEIKVNKALAVKLNKDWRKRNQKINVSIKKK